MTEDRLTLQRHPDLEDEEEEEPTLETPPVETPPTPVPEAVDDSKYFVTLDRRSLVKDIERLQHEDKEFANILNSYVGQKAKLKYQSSLSEAQARSDYLERELRRQQIYSMPNEEIEKRFASDPQFAREYAELVHSPQTQGYDNQLENIRATSAFETLVDTAASLGMSQDRVQNYVNALSRGDYDKDESGRIVHWSNALVNIQRDMMRELGNSVAAPAPPASPVTSTPPATPPTAPPPAPPKGNPNLSAPGPDLSRGSSPGNITKYTREQVDRMNPDELIRAFPGEGDFERAVASGLIEGYTQIER